MAAGAAAAAAACACIAASAAATTAAVSTMRSSDLGYDGLPLLNDAGNCSACGLPRAAGQPGSSGGRVSRSWLPWGRK